MLATRLATLLFLLPPRNPPRNYSRRALVQQQLDDTRRQELRSNSLTFVSGGKRVRAYVTFRQGEHTSSTRTALLVHGWGGHSGHFAALVEPLVHAGFRVVTLDLPAHGKSSGRVTNAFEMRRALLGLVQQLGQPHAVIAHSFGAMVTALAMNEGLAPKVCAFVAPMTSFNYAVSAFSAGLGLSEQARTRMMAHLENKFGISGAGMEMAETASARRVPLLVVHDQGDARVPLELGQTLVAAWPDAELYATSGLGHQRVLRDVAVVDELVRFVAAEAGPPG